MNSLQKNHKTPAENLTLAMSLAFFPPENGGCRFGGQSQFAHFNEITSLYHC